MTAYAYRWIRPESLKSSICMAGKESPEHSLDTAPHMYRRIDLRLTHLLCGDVDVKGGEY